MDADRPSARPAAWLEPILQALPDELFVVSAGGVILDWIPSEATPFPYPRDDVVGHALPDLLPAEAVAVVESAIRRALDGQQRVTVTFPFDFRTGRRWMEASALPRDGMVADGPCLVILLRDCTERVRASDALQEATVRQATLLSAIPDIVMEVDRDRVYTWANDAGYAFFGPDVLGREAAWYFVGEQTTYQEVAPLFSGDASAVYVESWQRRVDGRRRLLAWWCRPLVGPDGQLRGTLSSARDITEARLEHLLLEARIRLVQHACNHPLHEVLTACSDEICALTGSPVGFFYFVEPDGRTLSFQAWSTGAMRAFGLDEETGRQHFFGDVGALSHAVRDGRPVLLNDLPSLPRGEGLPEGHVPITRAMVLPVSRQGRRTAVLGVGNKAEPYDEEDLAWATRMADLLWDVAEHMRAEAVRQVEAERVLHRQKLEALGTMASGIAHEINSPINSVLNFAELIQLQVPDDPRVADWCRRIIAESGRMAGIVRNLLAFSRSERTSFSPAHLRDVIRDALSLTVAVLRKDGIRVLLDVPDALPLVKCRSEEIQQVLVNLFANARDALVVGLPGYHAEKYLRVACRPVERDRRRWVRTTVENNGAPIPAELQRRIFDPFFTTKPRGTGTGLGLSISFGIVTDHHGCLTVESEPGAPVRFHMDLPCDNGWDLPQE